MFSPLHARTAEVENRRNKTGNSLQIPPIVNGWRRISSASLVQESITQVEKHEKQKLQGEPSFKIRRYVPIGFVR